MDAEGEEPEVLNRTSKQHWNTPKWSAKCARTRPEPGFCSCT